MRGYFSQHLCDLKSNIRNWVTCRIEHERHGIAQTLPNLPREGLDARKMSSERGSWSVVESYDLWHNIFACPFYAKNFVELSKILIAAARIEKTLSPSHVMQRVACEKKQQQQQECGKRLAFHWVLTQSGNKKPCGFFFKKNGWMDGWDGRFPHLPVSH